MLKKKWLDDTNILWLMALPGLLYFLIFKYIPMAGNIIAFQNYDIFKGIFHSKWVGIDQFAKMFTYADFYKILRNTLKISFSSVLFGFPAPLILALFVNEVRRSFVKRSVQTFLYLPHFLSWVIVGGIAVNVLSTGGFVNDVLRLLGTKPIDFITTPQYFVGIIVVSGIWKEVGWGMIIYLAALADINPSLYEASIVDGAGRWKQMRYITMPSIIPAITILFLLRIGSVLDANVEQVLIFLNPLVRDVGEVVDTYVYRMGLLSAQYSYTTAIGMFKSIIGFTLVVTLNSLSKKTTGEGIY